MAGAAAVVVVVVGFVDDDDETHGGGATISATAPGLHVDARACMKPHAFPSAHAPLRANSLQIFLLSRPGILLSMVLMPMQYERGILAAVRGVMVRKTHSKIGRFIHLSISHFLFKNAPKANTLITAEG